MRNLENFQELRSIASPTTDALHFSSQDFRVIRFLLRLLSLWRPRSAGFLESYVYPVFVNLLLSASGPIYNSVRITEKSAWLYIELLYIIHELTVWLGHIFGNRYFASRDLETNVLNPRKPLTGIAKPWNRRRKILNAIVIISITFFSIMLCALFIVTQVLQQHHAERFSPKLPHVHGPAANILSCFGLIAIVYNLGVGLALFWTVALLYNCYATRLKIMENIFLKWKHSSVDAVSFFVQMYARPVKHSWKRISWWFVAHNIVTLAIPLYGYELAQAVSGRAYHSKHLPHFICYLIFVVTIWLAPTVVGELIKRRERKFTERINDISPWLLQAESRSLDEVHSVTTGGTHSHGEREIPDESLCDSLPQITSIDDLTINPGQTTSQHPTSSASTKGSDSAPTLSEYTFASRGKDLRNFLRFLKRRTPGLVSRGYSIQLNLSLISLIGAAISFLIRLHSMNSDDIVYRNCNCTMS